MHLNFEVSIFSPVGSPRVSSNPIFDSVLDSPTDNADLVGDNWSLRKLLAEDSTFVLVELESSLNSAGNWSSGIDLELHSISSENDSVLGGFPLVNLFSDGVAIIGSVDSGCSGWDTVHAGLDIRAGEVGWVSGGVLLAGGFWDSVLVGEFVDIDWFSSVAGSSGETVDDNLRGESHLGPLVSSLDIDSVSEGGGGSLSPA